MSQKAQRTLDKPSPQPLWLSGKRTKAPSVSPQPAGTHISGSPSGLLLPILCQVKRKFPLERGKIRTGEVDRRWRELRGIYRRPENRNRNFLSALGSERADTTRKYKERSSRWANFSAWQVKGRLEKVPHVQTLRSVNKNMT